MKLSSPLFRQNYSRIFKNHWKVQGNRRIMEYPIPKLLACRGTRILDAQEVAEPVQELELKEIPAPWDPPPPLNECHPKWKSKICHTFTSKHALNTKLAEGLQQAQLLIKTVVYEGLPERLQNLVGVADQPDQDELVKRCILLSQIFDGWQKKLPRKMDITKPGWSFPTPYGTPENRKLKLLLRNLLRLMESQTGIYEGILERSIVIDPECVLTTEKDDDLLQFNVVADAVVCAKKPLQPFASIEDVIKENSAELPDIFPVKCTIDLMQTNIYDILNFSPIAQKCSHPYIHTIFLSHLYAEHRWSKSQKMARAITACYAYATSQAKILYGDVDKLPEPITVQCVVSTGPLFSFVAYQLNTTDLDENAITRNMAWVSTDMQMYDHCKEEAGRVLFEGYNPEVYRWLLAFQMNGLSLSPPLSLSHLLPSESPVAGDPEPLNLKM